MAEIRGDPWLTTTLESVWRRITAAKAAERRRLADLPTEEKWEIAKRLRARARDLTASNAPNGPAGPRR